MALLSFAGAFPARSDGQRECIVKREVKTRTCEPSVWRRCNHTLNVQLRDSEVEVVSMCVKVKRVCRHDVMLGGRRRNLCRSTIWAWWLAGMLERQGNAGIQSVQRMNPFHGWKR
ncbi:uncharacterized protein [Physcomitrium patens]|uniref:uncharacterized protein isoform X1 n=1 Tax=Physcomitrium patens TaxID=3218 RepID=UPI000D164C28|nr:uncharacterized protein LOC112278564 isoform X1 [Physcomitrium patens]XP_024368021.1 uncharacterized protein LOC112278645 isoform X1 [Physcomitrium patens]XP_024386170.1 uncharacterized protein LOC112287437 isoform X1 [Physcomitrium patens]|eukprot:XP_024367941.1 uncharacterized protein LOC112278564 isoform X1 [Physcomitrella patens]